MPNKNSNSGSYSYTGSGTNDQVGGDCLVASARALTRHGPCDRETTTARATMVALGLDITIPTRMYAVSYTLIWNDTTLIATGVTTTATPTVRLTTTAAVVTLSTPRPAEARTSLTALPSDRSPLAEVKLAFLDVYKC